MLLGPRIEDRLEKLGKSQSWLARETGLSQTTINSLIRKPRRSTPHILVLARALRTTPAFLMSETDDPDQDAPPIPPPLPYQAVTLQVLLPGETALAEMFEGMLMAMDREAPLDEQARLLAQRLPIGLSQLRDLLPVEATAAGAKSPAKRPTRVRVSQ